MDAELIERWNRKVHRNDTVYIVGDFIFRCRRPPEEYFDLLKGKKHLILGNHDKYWLKKVEVEKHLESVSLMSQAFMCPSKSMEFLRILWKSRDFFESWTIFAHERGAWKVWFYLPLTFELCRAFLFCSRKHIDKSSRRAYTNKCRRASTNFAGGMTNVCTSNGS